MSKQRRVVCAAMRFKDGAVICSPRHFDLLCHSVIGNLPVELARQSQAAEQGFVDNMGVFMTREEAYIVAANARQIRHKTGPATVPTLYSEDLY